MGSKFSSREGSQASPALQQTLPAEVEGSEMVGRTVKGHQSEGRQTVFDEREEGDSVEKKQGKG